MAAAQYASVISLKHTGNVLGLVAVGDAEPPLEQLLGKNDETDEPGHLRVRLPGDPAFVNVPIGQLEAKRLAISRDVLATPQAFAVVDDNVQNVGAPTYGTGTIAPGGAGKKVVVVWQTDDESVPVETVLDGGGKPPPDSSKPTGATHKLVAYEGGSLYVLEV
jgi:hypothetical protein